MVIHLQDAHVACATVHRSRRSVDIAHEAVPQLEDASRAMLATNAKVVAEVYSESFAVLVLGKLGEVARVSKSSG